MDPLTLTLLVVGGIALVLLLVAVVAGDLSVDADGSFSLPAVAAFVGGVGFVGALAAALLPESLGGLRTLAAIGIGLVGALPIAWGVLKLSSSLLHMKTDETLTEGHLLGAHGVVITAVPTTGLGEVRLSVAGQHLKYYARSGTPLAVGTPVYVIDTPTATSVEVVSTAP